MQATPDKDLERLFQDKFDSFELTPSEGIWKGIVADLDKENEVKRSFPIMQLIAAASVVVVLGFGLLLLNPRQRVRLQGKAEQVAVETGSPSEDALTNSADMAGIREPDLNTVIPASSKTEKVKENIDNQHVTATVYDAPAPKAEEVLAPVPDIQVTRQDRALVNTQITIPEKDSENIFIAKESLPDTGRYLTSQRRSRNSGGGILGSVVNYVVGKVDPREDKIIRFSNDEDGDPEISGINLGLLKMKRLSDRQNR